MPSPRRHASRGFRNNCVASVTKSLSEVLRWQLQRIRAGLPPAPRVQTACDTADLEFIHRNGQPQNMVPAVTWIGHATAVQLHLDLGAKRSLGVHWGTFSLSDEPWDQPIHELNAARIAKGVTEAELFIMSIGATRRIPPRMNWSGN